MALLDCKELCDPHQRLLGFLFIPETHRQKVAVATVLPCPLVEFPCGNVLGNQPNFVEIFSQVAWVSLGEVSFDARLWSGSSGMQYSPRDSEICGKRQIHSGQR